MAIFQPQSIKGYELRERVGAGGFGEVYRAYQSAVGREVAVKVILPQHANRPDFIRHFEVEAQVIARLEHPHIVPLYDYWRDPAGAYLVMRWLPSTLRTRIEQGAWTVESTARLLEQIAGALTVAHRADIVHRDIKPGNILLDEDENAYLADFGIAKDLNLRDLSGNDEFAGSPEYVSPEQIKSADITARSDIYSLGYVIYELLTGEKAFPDATTPSAYFHKHLSNTIPFASQRNPRVPAAVDEVLQTATAKDPNQRYASVLRFAQAFRAAIPTVQPRNIGQPVSDPLTERELDVLKLIVQALDNNEIAQRLYLSTTTVKWYVRQIYSKLDVHSRHQAIVRTERLGLLEPKREAAPVDQIEQTVVFAAAHVESEVELMNPYKGLRAFGEGDAHDFFGRAALVEQLLNRLSERDDHARFLALVGPSGSGKSSVVKAGLLPALRKGALTASPRPFIAELFPGAYPFEELEAALLRIAVNPVPNLLNQLKEDRRGLVRAAKLLLPNDPDTELILIIDQFEELFTLVSDEAMRQQFIDNLLSAVADPRGRVRVIVTLRADFYDRPLMYTRLGEMMRSHTELLLPLNLRELEQAIVAPAERIGLTFEGGLVATILNDVTEQPGALPLLQFALTELFERRNQLALTLDAYNEGGGVFGALARRADELDASLSDLEQAAARQMFLRLVTLGEGVEDTRRRVLQSELLSLLPDSTLMEDVIQAFSQYRLLTLDRDLITRAPTVEVAHEALIREWRTLQGWLNDSREDIRLQRRLSHATAEWLVGRDVSFLATGARLEQFEALSEETHLALTPDERAFIRESVAENERQLHAERDRQARELLLAQQREQAQRQSANRLRLLAGVLIIAVIGALFLSGIALNNANIAAQEVNLRATQQHIAEVNFNRAEQQRLYFAADNALADGASGNVGMALALRSLQFGYTAAADAALLRSSRQGVVLQALPKHEYEVLSVAYSPDGTRIATASEGGTRISDAVSGEELLILPQEGLIHTALFSPDGSTVLTAGVNPVARLWDAVTGEEIRIFVHRSNVDFIYFSPDGSKIIAKAETVFQVWDAASGQRLAQYDVMNDAGEELIGIIDSPGRGNQFVRSDSENHVYLQDANTGEAICTIQEAGSPDWTLLWWADHAPRLVLATTAHIVYSWDTEACSPLAQFAGHLERIVAADYDPNQQFMVTGDVSGTAIQWDIETGRELAHYVSGGQYSALDISPNGQHMVMPRLDTAYIWDLTFPREPRQIVVGHRDDPYMPHFAPDGESIYVGGFGMFARWSLIDRTNTPMITYEQPIRTLDVSPDGRFLAISMEGGANGDHSNYLIDAAMGEMIREFAGHGDVVNFIKFSADGSQVASASFDATARIWDVNTGELLHVIRGHDGLTSSAVFSPDGQTLLTTSSDGTARVWNIASGEELQRSEHGAPVPYAEFSPDGSLIASADTNGLGHIWDAATGAELHTLSEHTATLWTAKFSPDGRQIVTSSWDGTAGIWDVNTGELVRMLDTGSSNALYWAEFSPDGETVIAGGEFDDRVYVWRVDLGQMIDSFCAHQPLELTQDERARYGVSDVPLLCAS